MEIDFWKHKNEIYTKVFERTFNADTRFVLSYGGSGSGKSYSEAQKEIILSFYPDGGNLLIVRQTYSSLMDSCFALVKGIIQDWGLEQFFNITKSPLSIENIVTGKKMIFRGLDDIEKIKSIAGVQRCWIEEASETKFSDIRELNRRIRGFDDIQITLLLNPVNEQHWIKAQFVDGPYRDKTTVIHSTYKDNKFVGDEYGEELEALKDIDINDYNIYALGKWGTFSEGLIFKGWRSVQEFPKDLDFWYGLDFGYTNDPTAIVRIAYDNKENTIYLDEVCYKTGLDNAMIANELKNDFITTYHSIYSFGDKEVYTENGSIFINGEELLIQEAWLDEQRLVKMLMYYNYTTKEIKTIKREINNLKYPTFVYCDGAEPKSVYELTQLGADATSAIKGAGSILAGIQRLKRCKVCYTRSSKNINKEVNAYSWVKDKKTDTYINTPEDKNNHICDAIRYGVYSHFIRLGIE